MLVKVVFLVLAMLSPCLGIMADTTCNNYVRCHECLLTEKCFFKYFLSNEKNDTCVSDRDWTSVKDVRGYGVTFLENCLTENNLDRIVEAGKRIKAELNTTFQPLIPTILPKLDDELKNGTTADTGKLAIYIAVPIVAVVTVAVMVGIGIAFWRKRQTTGEFGIANHREMQVSGTTRNVPRGIDFEDVDLSSFLDCIAAV